MIQKSLGSQSNPMTVNSVTHDEPYDYSYLYDPYDTENDDRIDEHGELRSDIQTRIQHMVDSQNNNVMVAHVGEIQERCRLCGFDNHATDLCDLRRKRFNRMYHACEIDSWLLGKLHLYSCNIERQVVDSIITHGCLQGDGERQERFLREMDISRDQAKQDKENKTRNWHLKNPEESKRQQENRDQPYNRTKRNQYQPQEEVTKTVV